MFKTAELKRFVKSVRSLKIRKFKVRTVKQQRDQFHFHRVSRLFFSDRSRFARRTSRTDEKNSSVTSNIDSNTFYSFYRCSIIGFDYSGNRTSFQESFDRNEKNGGSNHWKYLFVDRFESKKENFSFLVENKAERIRFSSSSRIFRRICRTFYPV